MNNSRFESSVKEIFSSACENESYGFKCGINGVKMKNNVKEGSIEIGGRFHRLPADPKPEPGIYLCFLNISKGDICFFGNGDNENGNFNPVENLFSHAP